MIAQHTARRLTPDAFAALGAGGIAFIKPGQINGQRIYTIHSADGAQIGHAPTRDLAAAAIRQHEMEPVDAV